MKAVLKVILVTLVAILSVNACSKTQRSASLELMQAASKSDLTKIPNVHGDLELYIDSSTIEVDEESDIRKAIVIYHFNTPIDVKGTKISYMYKETFYSCNDQIFIDGDIIFYDEKANPLFKGPKTEVQQAPKGSNVAAELAYVCSAQTNKPAPEKSDRGLIKPMNHYDI